MIIKSRSRIRTSQGVLYNNQATNYLPKSNLETSIVTCRDDPISGVRRRKKEASRPIVVPSHIHVHLNNKLSHNPNHLRLRASVQTIRKRYYQKR